MVNVYARYIRPLCFTGFVLGISVYPAKADPLNAEWALDAGASNVQFGSETSPKDAAPYAFKAFRGIIDRNGAAVLKLHLASLDTQNNMLDVRLRYLFFETFKFPEATIRTQIDNDDLLALEDHGEITIPQSFTLDLHGETKELTARIVASLRADKSVSVKSATPLLIRAEDFALLDGLARLEDAFYGEITPEFSVSFDFVFRPYETNLPALVATSKACETRLSEAAAPGQVSFRKGSYELAESSHPALERIVDVINDCDGITITVEGHTDSVGAESANQALSERRANSVAKYLVRMGLPETRVNARGRGETNPIAPNDTADNRAKNRRIEFLVDRRS